MTLESDYIFELPGHGRSVSDDDWQEIDAAHIEYWKAACSLFCEFSAAYRECPVSLELNWRPVLRRCQRHYQVMQRFWDVRGTPVAYDILEELPRTRVKVPVKIIALPKDDARERLIGHEVVLESFLHDVFLIMNIAAPGSCNFYNALLRSKKSDRQGEMSLSEFHFDLANLNSREGKWPSVKMIPLDTVHDWFASVRSGVLQIPRNRMEKVLFALLHVSKANLSPTIVIWLFYALETLFDTRAGENVRVLTDRAKLLLSPNEKQARILRKNLRAMYDLRSSFVHGGLEVAHPMHNEVLDPLVMDKYKRLAAVSEFGVQLLLGAVQMVIEKNWRWPEFNETIRGDNGEA